MPPKSEQRRATDGAFKQLSKKARRKRLAERLARLSPEQRIELETLFKRSSGQKALRKRVRAASGTSLKKLRLDGRKAKSKCCGKALHKMCSRCPRRFLLEFDVA